MTLRELIDHFKNMHNLEITMITCGVLMIYSFFINEAKLNERIDLRLSELVKKLSKKEIGENVKSLIFEICCNDLNGEDVEVPCVKYQLPFK